MASKNGQLPDGWVLKDADDITQGNLEKWEEVFNTYETTGRGRYSGAVVRATVEAKWFAECPIKKPDEVAEQKPAVIRALALAIDELYGEIVTIDPN